ncbi:hypothetical protein [Helicobacter typhlonius]|uniref:hypothetical protein n=1 Tax=Helicobacter typhlonius TaxID=76936 RepID=UPI002FE27B39
MNLKETTEAYAVEYKQGRYDIFCSNMGLKECWEHFKYVQKFGIYKDEFQARMVKLSFETHKWGGGHITLLRVFAE